MRFSACEQVGDEVEESGGGRGIVLHGIFGFLFYFFPEHMNILDDFLALFLDRPRKFANVLQYDDDIDENYYSHDRYHDDRYGRYKEEYVGVY
jgi:hypothetical protein